MSLRICILEEVSSSKVFHAGLWISELLKKSIT